MNTCAIILLVWLSVAGIADVVRNFLDRYDTKGFPNAIGSAIGTLLRYSTWLVLLIYAVK